MSDTACADCGRPVLWCTMVETGDFLALEPDPVPWIGPAFIAYNPGTQGGRLIDPSIVGAVERWQERDGVTVHRAHKAMCKGAPRG